MSVRSDRRRWQAEVQIPGRLKLTDPKRIPNRSRLIEALQWARRPERPGLALFGSNSGSGKTRTAYHVARWIAPGFGDDYQPNTVWLTGGQFKEQTVEHARTGNLWIRDLVAAAVVVIDDVDKAPALPGMAPYLFRLVDERFNEDAATVLTFNSLRLSDKFGPDFGPPLLRRIQEFCRCLNFDKGAGE